MIGVIGCGNMASAIVKGIHQKFPEEKFLTYTPSRTRAEDLAQAVNGKTATELKDLANCPVIIIGCKPQQFDDLSKKLKEVADFKNTYFISIMAAIPLEFLKKELGSPQVTRIMPNMPSLYGEGVSLLLHSKEVTLEWKQKCERYFSVCSTVHEIPDETLFDKITTVTGSGPAYVFQFAKTFTDQLESWGLDKDEARKMVTQLFIGSAKHMEQSQGKSFSTLTDEVTSKGGVTIEAVKVFEGHNLKDITRAALEAAYKRSVDISESLSR